MKVFIIALCAMGFGLAASAQTNMTLGASPVPVVGGGGATAAAIAKVPTTDPDNARYLKDGNLLASIGNELNAFDSKPCDIIFIGGTNTAGWRGAGSGIWTKSYAPRHALNFGVTGDTIQNVLWRLNNMEIQNLKPKVAIILIGANNLDDSAHAIADGIQAILANTQATFPGVKIILVSMLPNEGAPDKVKQVNTIIRSFADNSSDYFLDLHSLMPRVDETGSDGKSYSAAKGMSRDGASLNSAGYQIWADAMEPMLAKLLAGG
jgi:lysophospholipase L1-like esterase